MHAALDLGLQVGVEHDRVVRITEQIGVGLDAVRDVGVAEEAPREEPLQPPGVVLTRQHEEPQQVNQLVVSPVADVRPRVVGLDGLPVDALASDPVRVVAVGRRGVDEGRDDALQVAGVRAAERLPVLEDVAPVALVASLPVAVVRLDVDREVVPGTAGVAVAAAEAERQVRRAEALHLGAGVCRHRVERLDGEALRQDVEAPGVGARQRRVVVGDVRPHVLADDAVTLVEDAASHDVEQHVHAVAGRGHRLAGDLLAVRARDELPEPLRARLDVCVDLRAERVRVREAVCQADHVGGVLLDVGHEVPGLRLARGEGQRRRDEVRPTLGADGRLGLDRLPEAEAVELVGGEEHGVGREPGRPDGGRLERLARLGAVDGDRAQEEQSERRVGHELALLVRVGEVAADRLKLTDEAVRHQVLDAVQHAHRDGGVAVRDQLGGADEAEPLARAPGDGERQAEVVVGLLEAETVSPKRLGQAAAGRVQARVAVRERLPEGGLWRPVPLARARDEQERLAARPVLGVVDAVDRLVREEGVVGAAAPRREPARARREQPMIGVADDGDEERRHPVDVVDPVGGVPVHLHEGSRDRARVGVNRSGADDEAGHRPVGVGGQGGGVRSRGRRHRKGCWRGLRGPGRRTR